MDDMLRNTDGGGVGGRSLASNSPDIILERLLEEASLLAPLPNKNKPRLLVQSGD